jgi:hypothetical protein
VDLGLKSNEERDLTAGTVLNCLSKAIEYGWSDLEGSLRNRYSGGTITS